MLISKMMIVGVGHSRKYYYYYVLLLLLHLITHPTKCYTNSKVHALSEKNNSEQVRLQVFRKSRWTNRQIPQFDRQHNAIPVSRMETFNTQVHWLNLPKEI